MQRILMIDDDERLISTLRIHLRDIGVELEGRADGESGLQEALSSEYALIIIDGNLPKMDGFEVCKAIREKNQVIPILLLTSRVEEVDKVVGLSLGADDYVTKPYQLAELSARIRALIRRGLLVREATTPSEDGMQFGPLEIDLSRHEVRLDGTVVELTPLEFDVLLYFAERPGIAISKMELLKSVWQSEFDGYEHSVTLAVSRLRSKIQPNDASPQFIRTVRGLGYRFSTQDEV